MTRSTGSVETDSVGIVDTGFSVLIIMVKTVYRAGAKKVNASSHGKSMGMTPIG